MHWIVLVKNKMTTEFKAYQVPGIGLVQFMHDPDEIEHHGKYYAWVAHYGLAGSFSQSEDELKIRTGQFIEQALSDRKSELEEKLAPINQALTAMSIHSFRVNSLNSFEIKK